MFNKGCYYHCFIAIIIDRNGSIGIKKYAKNAAGVQLPPNIIFFWMTWSFQYLSWLFIAHGPFRAYTAPNL